MTLKKPYYFILFCLLFVFAVSVPQAQAYGTSWNPPPADRDTIDLTCQLGAISSTVPGVNDSVTVNFSLALDLLDVPAAVDSTQYPHYNLFISYGDGIVAKAIVIDTITDTSIVEVSQTDKTITYHFSHTYKLKPTKPVLVSVAKVKTTDTDPPPKSRMSDIPEWIDKVTTNPIDPPGLSDAEQKIAAALSSLALDAGEKKFVVPIAAAAGSTGTLQIATDTFQIDFHLGPVAQNDYIGILDLRGVDATVTSGSIFLHYNLTDFVDDDQILLEGHRIMAWQNEVITDQNFNDQYGFPVNSNRPDFKRVIRIDFTDLKVNEVRKYLLPFDCPASLSGSLDKPVYFYGVVVDSSMVEDYIKMVKDIRGDLLSPILVPVTDPNGTMSGSGVAKTLPSSHYYEVSETFRNALDELGGSIITDAEHWDYVREGHDPNSITIVPPSFCESPRDLKIDINVENYGFGGAKEITIEVVYPDELEASSISIYEHSFDAGANVSGALAPNADGEDIYQIKVTNVYLPGIRELALESGVDLLEIDEAGIDALRIQVQEKYGFISQANVILQARTKNLSLPRDLVVTGEVVFDAQDPIPMEDTAYFNPFSCVSPSTFNVYRAGIRAGYNVFSAFEQFDANHNPLHNYSLGAFFDFRIGNTPQLNYRLEANYNNWGFEDDGRLLKHHNVELLPMVRYHFAPRWAIGLGPSLLFTAQWEFEDETLAVPFNYEETLIGGVIDFNYTGVDNRFGVGVRGMYYPNAVQLPNNEQNLFGLQLYVTALLWER